MNYRRILVFACAHLLISFSTGQGSSAQCLQQPPDLTNWWRAEGSAEDFIGGNHGIFKYGATTAPGHVGSAFLVDGVDDYVEIPDSGSLNSLGSFSIEVWIFPTVDSQAAILTKWGDLSPWTNERSFAFQTVPGNGLAFAISDLAHQTDIPFHEFSVAGVLTLNGWNHVAAVFDQVNGTRLLYVDGGEVGQRTDLPAIAVYDGVADAAIGAQLRAPGVTRVRFNGMIDEPSFYRRALSPQEIQALYLAGSAGKCLSPTQEVPVTSVEGLIVLAALIATAGTVGILRWQRQF